MKQHIQIPNSNEMMLCGRLEETVIDGYILRKDEVKWAASHSICKRCLRTAKMREDFANVFTS